MSQTQNYSTGQYPYNFITGTTVIILKRDKFAREEILKIVNDRNLSDEKRKEKISRRIRILLNDTRDGTDIDEVIRAVLEIERDNAFPADNKS